MFNSLVRRLFFLKSFFEIQFYFNCFFICIFDFQCKKKYYTEFDSPYSIADVGLVFNIETGFVYIILFYITTPVYATCDICSLIST